MALYCRKGCGRFAEGATDLCSRCAEWRIGRVRLRSSSFGVTARCACGASQESETDGARVVRWARAHVCPEAVA